MFDETSRLINNWLTAAFKNEYLRLYGDCNKTLDFTYIDDFVDGVMYTINGEWNKEYNISGNNEVNLYKLAEYIIKETNSKSNLVYLKPEVSQPQNVHIDTSSIMNLGYFPKITIEEGIKRMIKFYKDNTDAWKKYVDKGRKFYNE